MPAHRASRKINELKKLIGHTPMMAIYYRWNKKDAVVYAKCEQYNFTGSIKDRMALHILEKAYENNQIQPESVIVEATSGNTGISFAALGRALGHPVRILMPDWLSSERKDLIRGFGAQWVPVSREQGGFLGSIRISEEMAQKDRLIFLPRQFENEANIEAHEQSTAPEIWRQLNSEGLKPHAFVAGVGTGGTVMGVGRFFRSIDPTLRIHPLEPKESPTLSTGHKAGTHRIQGISDEFIPAIVKLNELSSVISVSDGDAILMAQKITQSVGLGVGISSGANLLGAIQVQNQLGASSVVVTVLPDSNKKYLSTDLLREEPIQADYQTPKIEILGFKSILSV